MLRSLRLVWLAFLFVAFSVDAQTPAPSAAPPASQPQDAAPSTEPKKPKKVLTNEDLSKSTGAISVVGEAREKPKPSTPRTANAQYIASVRKQLEKLQKQIADIDKQLVDLKNFSSGEPSTNSSGVQLNKSYQREPIEVQIRGLQDQKKDLQAKMDAILDEARKKGVEPGELR
jgi:chaperonin cofactor prefoldin